MTVSAPLINNHVADTKKAPENSPTTTARTYLFSLSAEPASDFNIESNIKISATSFVWLYNEKKHP